MHELRTWIEVDRSAIKHNYRIFRSLIGKNCLLMAVAKSNAYGHSLVDFSKTISRMGADWIGVDSIVEALALRRKKIKKPILVLGYTLPIYYKEAAENGVSLTVSSLDSLRSIQKASLLKRGVKIHIKVDTGMHRQGFLLKDISSVNSSFLKNPHLILEGVYTHFAAAKNPAFPSDTEKQIREFREAVNILEFAGFRFLKHAAATAGTILFPESHFDMVRVGIGLYGLWPSAEVRAYAEDKIHLKPALSWKAVVGEVKELLAGARVGYDFTETLDRPSVVAILPVGYWHGYPRILSSIGYVVIRGRRAKVLGRVSMDMIVVDVSQIKGVRVGDVATLIGDGVSADELAELALTINYEIVTQLNPLIERVYK